MRALKDPSKFKLERKTEDIEIWLWFKRMKRMGLSVKCEKRPQISGCDFLTHLVSQLNI